MTDLTLLLKILSLVRVDKAVDLQIGFRFTKACLAFPILALMSSSDPPVAETMLPRYLKESTSFKAWPSNVIGVCCLQRSRITSVLSLFICSPVFAASSVRRSVFLCMCCCFWDIKQRSSAKSRSSRVCVKVLCKPVFSSLVVSLMIQSTVMRKMRGDKRQPCLTPVLTSKDSVSFLLSITLHDTPSYSC